MVQKTTRLEARLSTRQRSKIEQAAELVDESLSSFVIAAATERADHVIDEVATSVVPADYFDRLLASIDEPDPAPQLDRAVRRARSGSRIVKT